MNNAFMMGIGLGFVLGNIVMRSCPAAAEIYDTTQNAVKSKVQHVKTNMQQKKQQQQMTQEQI